MRCWYGLQRLDDLSCQRIFYRCRRSWRNSRLCRDHGGVVGEDGEGLAQQVQNLIPFLIPFPKMEGREETRETAERNFDAASQDGVEVSLELLAKPEQLRFGEGD